MVHHRHLPEAVALSQGGPIVGDRKNEDMFASARAQAWWALRHRFLETFKASKGEPYDPDAIISLYPGIED